jgi:hypothetical protein
MIPVITFGFGYLLKLNVRQLPLGIKNLAVQRL